MTTLREAAQRAMKSLEDAIKVWTEEMEFRSCIDASDEWLESADALRDALLEPEQEPVADTESDVLTATYMLGLHAGKKSTNRQPLTDEEIHDCFQQSGTTRVETRRLIARAIERAHGIGGEE